MTATYATLSDVYTLKPDNNRLIDTGLYKYDIPVAKEDLPALFGLPSNFEVKPFHLYTHSHGKQPVFADPAQNQNNRSAYSYNYYSYNSTNWRYQKLEDKFVEDNCPMLFLLRDKEGGIKDVVLNTGLIEMVTGFQFVGQDSNSAYFHHWDDLHHCQVAVALQVYGKEVVALMTSALATRLFGLSITTDLTWKLGRFSKPIDNWKEMLDSCGTNSSYYYDRDEIGFNFTLEALGRLNYQSLKTEQENQVNFVRGVIAKGYVGKDNLNLSGIKKTYDKILPLLDAVKGEDPLTYMAFRSLANRSSKSVDGVKISVIFNEAFKGVTTLDEAKNVLKSFSKDSTTENISAYYSVEEAIRKMPLWQTKRKAVVKSQAGRAFSLLMQEYEFLNLDEQEFPLTSTAIKDGELPIGTFFRKSEQYFLLNDNWELWEEMLKKHKEVAIELANEVKGRTTYEKDLMSYFYFVLHALPEYLKKMTGKKWTCSPKLVNSESELEPPSADDEGVARKRSALTPIVDNDECTVEVPYASLAIYGGRGTTYCYSHDYHLVTKGLSLKGNAASKDFETKLNGKDDYGLMFYTLTGSEQGRGYPTFLIIFERRSQKGDTKVHFHRTHPSRSKSGDYNPIHNWIKVCYNWMAGNVNKSLIKAQQGDLFFVDVAATADKLEFNAKVNSYDKHTFETEVEFAEYDKAAKSNILGYVRFTEDKMLRHTEHDDVLIPAGTYAIHQCRSWEANPKGVWSLRID